MKALLMHRDRDFDAGGDPSPLEEALIEDLGLDSVLAAMAGGDGLLFQVARRALLSGLEEPEAIGYRQEILRDCLEHREVARELYGIVVEATESQRIAGWGMFSRSPGSVLYRALRALELLLESLRKLRQLADAHAAELGSEGWGRFFAMIEEELDDNYLEAVAEHLRRLGFRGGVLSSARLGPGARGRDYVLRWPLNDHSGIGGRISSLFDHSTLSFRLPPRDESGARALGELRDRGINLVADAAAQSADHIVSFFAALRAELGFYVACVNLSERLAERGVPTCWPASGGGEGATLEASGLCDAGLALRSAAPVVGNDVAARGRALIVVTGANQGGKSTFLRSAGLAQLMMQGGMFVAAETFAADPRSGVFTHFKREEDAAMRSGKLDEELARMSEIVDALSPRSLVLCNESFAATNEREGAEIARQIVSALLDAGVKVLFVTHMYELAHGFERDSRAPLALFLRAEREQGGRRTFRLLEGEPLPTSFGADVYRKVFAADALDTVGADR